MARRKDGEKDEKRKNKKVCVRVCRSDIMKNFRERMKRRDEEREELISNIYSASFTTATYCYGVSVVFMLFIVAPGDTPRAAAVVLLSAEEVEDLREKDGALERIRVREER